MADTSSQGRLTPSSKSPSAPSLLQAAVDGSPSSVRRIMIDTPDVQDSSLRGLSLEELEAEDTPSILSPPKDHMHTRIRNRRALRSSEIQTIRESSTINDRDSLRIRVLSNTVGSFTTPVGPHWEPGAEPGIDPEEESIEDLQSPNVQCAIVVFDYSETKSQRSDFDEDSFRSFIKNPRPDWVVCRWICVDGLNSSIVKLLGRVNKLHPLAIEDTLKARSRPKADWYADHCYICLTMQRLVHAPMQQDVEPDCERKSTVKTFGAYLEASGRPSVPPESNVAPSPTVAAPKGLEDFSYLHDDEPPVAPMSYNDRRPTRTLQRWRGGTDSERVEYMEAASALLERGHSTHIEQVSIFMTADNNVITFFEGSANEVIEGVDGVGGLEARITREHGVLRRCPDASMLLHAVLDVIVDLALPIADAYDYALGNLQLQILKDPNIKQPHQLFTLISEIDLFEAAIQPVAGLITAIQEYEPHPIQESGPGGLSFPASFQMSSTVSITPLTTYYLNDIKDHVLLLTTQLDRMHRNTEHLTNLIFNVLHASRSDSMKQLTIVTVFFLPINFLANFLVAISNDVSTTSITRAKYWYIGIPITYVCIVGIFLARKWILRLVASLFTRKKSVRSLRRHRFFKSRRLRQVRKQQENHVGNDRTRVESLADKQSAVNREARTSEGASKFA